jgi:23S rRNA pseudouridine2457 synthase
MGMEPVFQLRQRHVRRVAIVKIRERQGKFRAKLFQRHFGAVGPGEDKIGRFPDGRQVIHQGARPVEDDVADHALILTTDFTNFTDKISIRAIPRNPRFNFEEGSLCSWRSLWFKNVFTMLIAFHKPYGVLSQFTGDGPARRTLAEFDFPKDVYPIGRLDADSEGLLLLSDEPEWNKRLLHPRQAHEREYWAQVERIPTPEALKKLGRGVVVQGRKTLPCRAWLLEPQPEVVASSLRLENIGAQRRHYTIPPRDPPIRFRKNVPDCWIGLELIEGKNRQVRRMTAAIGHPTLRLIRVRIGGFKLGTLAAGEWKVLTMEERRSLAN